MPRLSLTLVALLLCSPARAETSYEMHTLICADTKTIEHNLTDKFKEVATGAGLDKQGNLIRIFQSPTTFTVLSSSPDGTSCLEHAGDDWQTAPPSAPGDKT